MLIPCQVSEQGHTQEFGLLHALNDSLTDGEWDWVQWSWKGEKVLSGLIFMSLESVQPCE